MIKREMILLALCGVALILAVYAAFVFVDLYQRANTLTTMQQLVDSGVHLYAMGDGDVELRFEGGSYRVHALHMEPNEQEFDEFADAWAAWLAAMGREAQP